MRRWILLGILVITASWGGWMLVQRHREAIERDRQTAWNAAFQRATQAFYAGDYAMAEKVFTDILPETEKLHPQDRNLAELLSMLGTSYSMDKKEEQAEPVLKQALQVYAEISPPDSLGAERTEENLAGIYRGREDYASAEHHYSQALSFSDKLPNGPAYERGDALLNLGFLRMLQARYPEAEQFLDRSVETLASDSGPWAQRDLASALYRLGGVYAEENRYSEAKQQYLKALKMQEKLSGPDSREVANTLLGLGAVYQDEGKYPDSESFYKKSTNIFEKTVGPEHPDLAEALEYLGCLYRDQQQFDITKARPLLERALAIREKTLGATNANTANTLSDLSLLNFYEQKFGEAERLARQALPVQEKAYGPETLAVSTTLNRLGLAERELKKLAEAETSLKKALAIREKHLPATHPWIAISLDNLASVYLAQGELEKAAPLIKRARAIRSRRSTG